MKLSTPRLLIRSPLESDILFLCAIYSDPDVTKYVGGPKNLALTRDVVMQEIKEPPEWSLWTVVENTGGKPVGDAGLIEKEIEGQREIELSYFFAPEYWGRGYATEAALALVEHARQERKLKRLIALIHQDNEASKRVATKAGFAFEREVLTKSGNLRQMYSRTL